MRNFWLSPIILLSLVLFPTEKTTTQVASIESQVTHIYGDSIFFSAEIVSEIPVIAATLLFQAEGDSRMNVSLAEVSNLGNHVFQVKYLYKLSDYPIRPYSVIQYHWELNLAADQVIVSPNEVFLYDDNRFEWEEQERGSFRVHWFEGDQQFAQDIISIAEKGVSKIKAILALPDPGDVDIYIYPDDEMMHAALPVGGEDWIAAHADPDLEVILAALPDSPEQWLLAEQRIPHELMHILLYRETEIAYQHLPHWLKEGLASAAELYPNSDYRITLDTAAENGELLPLRDLCSAFPNEPTKALLAYAESQSFVQYLQNTVGASGLQGLVTAYANGLDCESGAKQALEISLAQAERNWQRDSLPIPKQWRGLVSLLPWLMLFLVVVGFPVTLSRTKKRTPRSGQNQ